MTTKDNAHAQYRHYVIDERHQLNQQLPRDIAFWQQYLHDTTLTRFPKSTIIARMKNQAYSTYLPFPAELMAQLSQQCAEATVSISELFCGAIALSIKKTAGALNTKIFMNLIRSARNNETHDLMLGCFLRLDPIKVDLQQDLDLTQFARAIQASRIQTELYQACSSMVKLASLNHFYRKKRLRSSLLYCCSFIYSKLLRRLMINPNMLVMYPRLRSFRTNHQFLVNVNLLSNFIKPPRSKTLFGMELKQIKLFEHDLSRIDDVLDICFLRNENSDQSYLVISGNLTAEFRAEIGKEIIRQLSVDFISSPKRPVQSKTYPASSVAPLQTFSASSPTENLHVPSD